MLSKLTEEVRHSSGGNIVKVEAAPYAVVVGSVETGALCTGTLVALNFVLTVARCLYNDTRVPPSSVVIWAGVDNVANFSYRLEDNDTRSTETQTQWQRAKKVLLHPNFHPTYKDAFFGYNDLALILLHKEFEETPKVQAIKVGNLDWGKIDNIKCKIASYGVVNPFTLSEYDDYLKMSEVELTRPCPCHDTLRRAFGARTDRWLCANPYKSDPTPCVGAGGASVVCGDMVIGLLIGLVSFDNLHKCEYSRKTTTVSCENRNTLPVFLDLCPFIPFINYAYGDPVIASLVDCSNKASYCSSSIYIVLVIMVITSYISRK